MLHDEQACSVFLASLKLKSIDVRRTSASIGWECGVLVVISLDPASPRQKDHPVHRYWDVGERSGGGACPCSSRDSRGSHASGQNDGGK